MVITPFLRWVWFKGIRKIEIAQICKYQVPRDPLRVDLFESRWTLEDIKYESTRFNPGSTVQVLLYVSKQGFGPEIVFFTLGVLAD